MLSWPAGNAMIISKLLACHRCSTDNGELVVLRTLLAAGNMVTAFVLAILTIIFLGLNYPGAISVSLRWARVVKDMITGSGINPAYNVWLEFLLEERQLVFIGYTIIMRMVLAALTYLGSRVWPREYRD